VDHDREAERKAAEVELQRKRREDAEMAFEAWLKQKQRDAAERRRELHRQQNDIQPTTTEVRQDIVGTMARFQGRPWAGTAPPPVRGLA